MPVSRYFDGNGEKVMDNMEREYGPDKGKRVFYALANKKKATPKDEGSDRYGIRKK